VWDTFCEAQARRRRAGVAEFFSRKISVTKSKYVPDQQFLRLNTQLGCQFFAIKTNHNITINNTGTPSWPVICIISSRLRASTDTSKFVKGIFFSAKKSFAILQKWQVGVL
jgi:hypothetical protein